MVIEYPIYIEIPEDYWTTSTTIGEEYEPDKYWHGGGDDD